MSNDTIRGLKNKAHRTAEATRRRAGDRTSNDSLAGASQKTHPRAIADAQTGEHSPQESRPIEQFSSSPDNPAGTQSIDRGDQIVADGGYVGIWCSHPRTRRYGRTDARGKAVIEERCTTCGRTVSMGGSR
jgi:hypothetical protein